MDKDNCPEPHTQLTFFLAEYVLVGARIHLSGGVMVETKLDREPDEAAYEPPEGTTLSLRVSSFQMSNRGQGIRKSPLYRDTSATK